MKFLLQNLMNFRLIFFQIFNKMLRSLNKASHQLSKYCDCRTTVVYQTCRNYRGRETHNIGKTHGLLQEKKFVQYFLILVNFH